MPLAQKSCSIIEIAGPTRNRSREPALDCKEFRHCARFAPTRWAGELTRRGQEDRATALMGWNGAARLAAPRRLIAATAPAHRSQRRNRILSPRPELARRSAPDRRSTRSSSCPRESHVPPPRRARHSSPGAQGRTREGDAMCSSHPGRLLHYVREPPEKGPRAHPSRHGNRRAKARPLANGAAHGRT